MSSVPIILKKSTGGKWILKTENGHLIADGFRGDEYQAREWARIFISSWYNWVIKLETEEDKNNEKKD